MIDLTDFGGGTITLEGVASSELTADMFCLPECASDAADILVESPFTGDDGRDFLTGDTSTGDEVYETLGGDDIVFAAEGDDTIDGGAGDDWLVGGEGADYIDGGEGDELADGGARGGETTADGVRSG